LDREQRKEEKREERERSESPKVLLRDRETDLEKQR
tara:strand:- start:383 stop:490 length:108 start_codon:yes stop_codon:yes gene_type:complete